MTGEEVIVMKTDRTKLRKLLNTITTEQTTILRDKTAHDIYYSDRLRVLDLGKWRNETS